MDVVVGEDDPIQRERVIRMISRLRPAWRQVAQAGTADGVLAALESLQPDILVLDIHLDGEGPRWIRRLPSGVAVIFTTVDSSMAVDAFDVSAADYVLKPLEPTRLDRAFERAELRLRAMGTPPDPLAGYTPLSTVVAARGADLVLFQVDDICYLQADNKYTRIVSRTQEGLVRTTIAEFERRLDPRHFKRIHRGTLLNMRMAQRIWRDDLGRLRVQLPCAGGDLYISRPYEGVFRVL
jgi:DNA-binding LytR/AlgR family response regulator